MAGRLQSVMFRGPAGTLEGLWKEAVGRPRGAAVFAHPHPLHGGTMHSRVVYRVAQALTKSGYTTLRFNFRGVGLSEGRYDAGGGETHDFRAALAEAQHHAGLPLVAGGFSFGAAVALRATVKDPRIEAFIGLGLPVATESGRQLPRPAAPALFAVGERDVHGPPEDLERFLEGSAAKMVVIPGADHFFDGSLELLEATITTFLEALPDRSARREETGS